MFFKKSIIEIAVITPLKRLENIPLIFSNLRYSVTQGKSIKIHWFPIFDKSEEEWFSFWSEKLDYLGKEYPSFLIYPRLSPISKALAGHAHRNIVLKEIQQKFNKKIWIINNDDDNIVKSELFDYLIKNKRKLSSSAGLLVSQQMKDGRLRLEANKDKVVVCHVDTAMLVFRPKFLKGLTFIETDYCADGHFIQKFYEMNKRKIYIEKEPLCYYNYLQK